MKKTPVFSPLVIAAALAVTSLSSTAQKLAASKIPAPVKEAFAKTYPGITASWEKEKTAYEAGFKMHGKTMSALFDANGTMKETEMDIRVSELPASVSSYIKEHYKGAAIKEAAKITKAGGEVLYEAEVNKTDILFHENGSFYMESKE